MGGAITNPTKRTTVERRKLRTSLYTKLRAGKTLPIAAAELGLPHSTALEWTNLAIKAGKLPAGVKMTGNRGGGPKPKRPKAPTRAQKEEKLAQRERFKEHMVEGDTYLQAAEKEGVPRSTAYGWALALISAGIVKDAMIHRVSGAEADQLRAAVLTMVSEGHSLANTARHYGVGYSTVQTWARDAGLTGKDKILQTSGPLAPAPIPYAELSPRGVRWLQPNGDGFGAFRVEALQRDDLPWAAETGDRILQLYRSPEDEYVVLNAPPGVGKSTLITHDFLAWVECLERAHGRELTALLGHRQMTKASAYIKRLRATFSHNERLIETFGRFRPETSRMAAWSTEEILIEPLSWAALGEKESTFTAGAYEAALLSGRFRINCWDDVIDESNTGTAEAREKLADWWWQTAETRQNEGGLTILSNARYGPEDLSWYVTQDIDENDLDDDGEPRPLYVRIRWAAHDDANCREEAGHQVQRRDLPDGEPETLYPQPWPAGCLLDPKRVSYKKLRHAKIKNEKRYRLVYQQEDSDPVGFLAQRVWFEGGTDAAGVPYPGMFVPERRFGADPRPAVGDGQRQLPAVSVMTCDPSGSRYWVVAHWLVYPDGAHVLYRAVRRPMQAPDLLYRQNDGTYTGYFEEMWSLAAPAGLAPTYAIVEAHGTQKWLTQYPFVAEWMAQRGVFLIPHATGMNKNDPDRGVEMLRPLYQSGRVEIPYFGPEEVYFADAWRQEACSWPEGGTSDIIMAHWFLLYRLPNLMVAQVQDDEEELSPDVPAWARSSQPAWAKEAQSRDRDRMVVAR